MKKSKLLKFSVNLTQTNSSILTSVPINQNIFKIIISMIFFQSGHLQYFYVDDWKYVNEYRHITGIKSLFPEPHGTKLVLFDNKLDAFVYNPVFSIIVWNLNHKHFFKFLKTNDNMIEVPDNKGGVKNAFWENQFSERVSILMYIEYSKSLCYAWQEVFVTADATCVHTYVLYSDTIEGKISGSLTPLVRALIILNLLRASNRLHFNNSIASFIFANVFE